MLFWIERTEGRIVHDYFIITNSAKDKDFIITDRIADYLKENGCRYEIWKGSGSKEKNYHYTDPDVVPAGTECVIVLGGDGTLLEASRDLVRKNLPLLGINLGNMGFLAEVDKRSVYPALDKLIRDQFEIENRFMLTGSVFRKGTVLKQDIALNDIVISREGPLHVACFNNFVNGEFLNSYHADGIILSTPTGSTGYSLSAGGPIVAPNASMIIMTPVAPHTMNSRSVVFPAEDVISVEIGEGRHGSIEHCTVTFDGASECPVCTGDRIVVKKAEAFTRIIKLSHLNFIEVLRQKMQ